MNTTAATVRATCFYASTVTLTTQNNSEDSTLAEPWVHMRITHRDSTAENPMYQEAVFTAAEWKALIEAAVIAND